MFLKSNNHKEDIFDEYFNLENNDLDIKEFLNKYNFDYLLVNEESKSLLKELQNNANYQNVLEKVTDFNNNSKTYLFKRIVK